MTGWNGRGEKGTPGELLGVENRGFGAGIVGIRASISGLSLIINGLLACRVRHRHAFRLSMAREFLLSFPV